MLEVTILAPVNTKCQSRRLNAHWPSVIGGDGAMSKYNRKVDYDEMFGARYGRLTVLGLAAIQDTSKSPILWKWLCECDCGGYIVTSANALRVGDAVGCGCGNTHGYDELFGLKSGRLTVLGLLSSQDFSGRPVHWKWVCECECGETVLRSARAIRLGYTKGCDYCCLPRGEDNHNWTGGDKRPGTTEWRGSIFERDAYTCQACGQVGGALNAHHLHDFSTYPDLGLDPDNGVTLCKTCHADFHSWCGGLRASTTPQQYYNWLVF
jgi:hypothetical protein